MCIAQTKKDLGKFEQKISHLDYGHINDLQHMCLEEIFGSTSKPPNDIYVELTLGKQASI